jgi:4-amino-4-deoxy-L-arabinose transferase-like glycosyltransferase
MEEILGRSTSYEGGDKYIFIECVVLLGLYFATRLIHLTLLPVYMDEAIYIRLAQTMGQDLFGSSLRRGDVKFTLAWLSAVFLVLPGDPLWLTRGASVFAGGLSLLGIYLIGRQIYSSRIGTAAAILYIVCPLELFHDRMIVADVVLDTCGIYTLLFSLLLVKKARFIDALGLGLSMGLGMLSKLPGVFFLSIPLITSLLIAKAHKRGLVKKLLLSYCLTFLVILPVLLHPLRETALKEIDLKTVATSEGLTVFTWIELTERNVTMALNDLRPYLTLPILLICVISLAMTIYRKDKRGLLLLMLCFMPFLALVGSSKVHLPPRYFLFVISPLLVFAAWGIVEIADRVLSLIDKRSSLSPRALGVTQTVFLAGALIALSIPSIGFDYAILSDPTQAPLPFIDRWQYIEGWLAGYGVPEIVAYVRDQASDKKVEGRTNPSSPLLGNALSMYFHNDPLVTVKRENLSKPPSWDKIGKGSKTFVVLNLPRDNVDFAMFNPRARLVSVYPRPGNKSWLEVYELTPPCGVSISFDSAFYDVETRGDHWWSWMGGDGQVSLTSPWKHSLKANVHFTSWSLARERTLQVFQNGEPLAELIVPVEPAELSLPDVALEPGRNTFTFSTYPGAEVIDSVLRNGDSRDVSIALSDVTLNKCRHTRLPPPAQPLEASFGGQVELLGYAMSPERRITPRGKLSVTLYWQSLAEMDQDYTVFVHLVDQAGRIYSQHDGEPAAGLYPTSRWKKGEIVEDEHSIEIPVDISVGCYSLRVGMYLLSTMERLQISSETAQMDHLMLGSVEILPGVTEG